MYLCYFLIFALLLRVIEKQNRKKNLNEIIEIKKKKKNCSFVNLREYDDIGVWW